MAPDNITLLRMTSATINGVGQRRNGSKLKMTSSYRYNTYHLADRYIVNNVPRYGKEASEHKQ